MQDHAAKIAVLKSILGTVLPKLGLADVIVQDGDYLMDTDTFGLSPENKVPALWVDEFAIYPVVLQRPTLTYSQACWGWRVERLERVPCDEQFEYDTILEHEADYHDGAQMLATVIGTIVSRRANTLVRESIRELPDAHPELSPF